MKHVLALLLAGLIGCSSIPHTEKDIEPPELLGYVPLPPFEVIPVDHAIKLRILLRIGKDGSVEQARLLGSTGNRKWDSLAEQSIKQWRYAPPLRNGVAEDVWIHQQVVVQFENSILMSLGELSTARKPLADSLYALLSNGADFETLVMQFSESPSRGHGGFLGSVDIQLFAPHVREALRHLDQGAFTPPLRTADGYVIYKRLKNVAS